VADADHWTGHFDDHASWRDRADYDRARAADRIAETVRVQSIRAYRDSATVVHWGERGDKYSRGGEAFIRWSERTLPENVFHTERVSVLDCRTRDGTGRVVETVRECEIRGEWTWSGTDVHADRHILVDDVLFPCGEGADGVYLRGTRGGAWEVCVVFGEVSYQ